jgi:hypothetical protein
LVKLADVSHAGSWLCHTSVWPRTIWPWARAWATSRSAAEKSRTPRCASTLSHFIAFSGVTLLNSRSRMRV